MAKFFQKNKQEHRFDGPHSPKPEKVELIDPVLYIGELDDKKYPFLPLEKKEKPEEEVENPLNKR